tara:strand:- start:344 stop:754 length:411 start_codon:yes stop_codon:yes gene_type:complete
MFEEINNIQTSNKDITSFSIIIGIILFIISGFLIYYGKEDYQFFAITASTFIAIGIILPILLKPIYLVWMIFAVILGWIMTRIILSVLFYLIITPIGLFARLIGEDFLGLKKMNTNSYWNNREKNHEINQDYEKQF